MLRAREAQAFSAICAFLVTSEERSGLAERDHVKRFFNWNPDRSFFSYHAAKGWVLFCRCGDVGNARALSMMSTAPSPAIASRQTAIGARSVSA